MTPTQTLDQTIFTMSTIYGILSNEELKSAMEEDTNKILSLEICGNYVELNRLIKEHTLVLQGMIQIDKVRNLIGTKPIHFQLQRDLEKCKSLSLHIARKASKLIIELKQFAPREVYDLQLWGLQFIFDKHQEYNTNHD